jgi:tRNA/rRNA methyltransferase
VPRTPAEVVALAVEQLQAGRVGKVAMVFGTERTGLLINEMALCQELISIPADPVYSSLNLAQAAQIVSFSLRQQVMLAQPQPPADLMAGSYADHAAVERLHVHLEQALIAIGYLDPAEPKRLMPRLRRLFSRTRLEVSEVDLLRGICKQMEKVSSSREADRCSSD